MNHLFVCVIIFFRILAPYAFAMIKTTTNFLQPFFLLLFFVSLISCSGEKERVYTLYSDVDTTVFQRGDTVFPFGYINPKEKGWKIIIEIAGDDLSNLSVKVPGRKLSTAKPQVLKLISNWKFIYNGGDLATVTSTILVYRNGTLVDQQGIVLDENQVGLQSIKFGWISPVNSKEIYKTLKLMDENMF
jgi:hypothetical protein